MPASRCAESRRRVSLRSVLGFAWMATVLFSAPGAAQPRFDYMRQIGVVAVQKNGRPCLAIPAPDLPNGTRLALVWVPMEGAGRPPQIRSARVTGRQPNLCDIPEAAEPADSSYRVTTTGGPLNEGPSFAVLIGSGRLAVTGSTVAGDLDGDGVLETFRVCTSTEGLHLTVWSGEPLKGTRRWHRYFYLGYAVEPSCEEPDYKEP
jgi:hypothetical protein